MSIFRFIHDGRKKEKPFFSFVFSSMHLYCYSFSEEKKLF